MKNKILALSLLTSVSFSLLGCSSKGPGTQSNLNQRSGEGQAKAPSPLNPNSPPKVTLKGVGEGDLILSSSVELNLEIQNYPMEAGWQHAVVVLNQTVLERVTEDKKSLRISGALVEGLNQVVVYLERSWGESIKAPTAVASVSFFYKKKDPTLARDFGPTLILTSPRASYGAQDAKKIMFDFLVLNAGARKYRVYYSIAGELREVAAENAPYYFYNLPSGDHSLKVELVDARGKVLKTPFSSSSVEFKIEP